MTINWLSEKEQGAFLISSAEGGARSDAMFRLMLGTGLREGECIPLLRRDFDFDRGTVELNKHTVAAYELTKVSVAGWPNYKPKKRLTLLEYDWDGVTGGKRRAIPATLQDEYGELNKAIILSGLKASRQIRTVPLSGVIKAVMKDWTDGMDRTAFAFRSPRGGMLHRATVYRQYKKAATKAGLPPEKQHPHCLRHSFAITYLRRREGQGLAELSRILGHASIATTAIYLQFVVSDLREAMKAAGMD